MNSFFRGLLSCAFVFQGPLDSTQVFAGELRSNSLQSPLARSCNALLLRQSGLQLSGASASRGPFEGYSREEAFQRTAILIGLIYSQPFIDFVVEKSSEARPIDDQTLAKQWIQKWTLSLEGSAEGEPGTSEHLVSQGPFAEAVAQAISHVRAKLERYTGSLVPFEDFVKEMVDADIAGNLVFHGEKEVVNRALFPELMQTQRELETRGERVNRWVKSAFLGALAVGTALTIGMENPSIGIGLLDSIFKGGVAWILVTAALEINSDLGRVMYSPQKLETLNAEPEVSRALLTMDRLITDYLEQIIGTPSVLTSGSPTGGRLEWDIEDLR